MCPYVTESLLVVFEMFLEVDVMLVCYVLEDGVSVFLSTSVQQLVQILVYGRFDFIAVVVLHFEVPRMHSLKDILQEELLHFSFGLLVVNFKERPKIRG